MNLHELKPNSGAKHRRKRLGCGESSGHGKTCCRGHKGQKARSGGSIRPGFEGGQMPLHRRLPKRGFNNKSFADKILAVNLNLIDQRFEAGAVVNEATLREARLVNGACDGVKILGTGELTKALSFQGVKCSASAREKITRAGGSVQDSAAS